MHPQRAAQLLAVFGGFLLLIVFAQRIFSLLETNMQRDLTSSMTITNVPAPVTGSYIFSPDGSQVTFQQQVDLNGKEAWFQMPLIGGQMMPASAPENNLRPFILRNGKLFVQLADGIRIINGSPANLNIIEYRLAPDRKYLAYAASSGSDYSQNVSTGLYILDNSGNLSWLGDFSGLRDLAWLSDGAELAFIASNNATNQVFKIDRAGQKVRQLTQDTTQKSSPQWSPDRKTIIYQVSADPAPMINPQMTPTTESLRAPPIQSRDITGLYYLEQINNDGTQAHRITKDPQPLFNVNWINHGTEIAFAIRQPDYPKSANLFALNPTTGLIRRVYPPYQIAALDCPPGRPKDVATTVKLTVINSSLSPADIPVLLRSGSHPFSRTGPWNTGTPHSSTVKVQAQRAQTVTYTIPSAPGIQTFVSLLIVPHETFAMDEAHCVIENTYVGLPNLPFLPCVVPLAAVGMVLCIPMLRHEKKRHFWLLWAAVPLLIAGLILFEARLLVY